MARLPDPHEFLKVFHTLTLDNGAKISHHQKCWKHPVLHLAVKNLHFLFFTWDVTAVLETESTGVF